MNSQPWLSRVRKQLAKHVLPPSYVRRFVEELADHLADLEEENMSTEADVSSRLGEPEQVAEAAVVAYRRRSFFGRHPVAAFLVFAISPVMTQWLLLLVGAIALATCGVQGAFDWYEHHWCLSLIVVVCSIFLSVLYGELAMRLGIGRKWMLACCAVLGVIAMFWESAYGRYAGTDIVMLPMQFAAPLAVGWWFPKLKCNHRYAATKFLVFAISPVPSYTLLFAIVPLALMAPQLLLVDVAPAAVAAWTYVSLLLMFVVPTVVTSLLCYELVKGFGSGKKWMVVSCMVLATLAAMPLMPLLLMYLVPTVVASLLYCKLAMRSGTGRKWMLLSCAVLATCAALHYFQSCPGGTYDGPGHCLVPIGRTSVGLAQFLAPLAIGWCFMRREHDQGHLQLAS